MNVPWAIPGQKVICIVNEGWKQVHSQKYLDPNLSSPTKGDRLTIREVETFGDLPYLGLRFEEIRNPASLPDPFSSRLVEAAFNYTGFRPLQETSIDVFHKILKQTERENELGIGPTKIRPKAPVEQIEEIQAIIQAAIKDLEKRGRIIG